MNSNTVRKNASRRSYTVSPFAVIAFLLTALQLTGWILYILIDQIEKAANACNFIPAVLIPIVIAIGYTIIYIVCSEQYSNEYPTGLYFSAIWVPLSLFITFLYYRISIPGGYTLFTAAKNLEDIVRYLIKAPLFAALYVLLPVLLSNISDVFAPACQAAEEEEHAVCIQETKKISKIPEKQRKRHLQKKQEYMGRRTAPTASASSVHETGAHTGSTPKHAIPASVKHSNNVPPVTRPTEAKKKEKSTVATKEAVRSSKTASEKTATAKHTKTANASVSQSSVVSNGKREATSRNNRKNKGKTSAKKKKNAHHKQRRAKRRKKNKKK